MIERNSWGAIYRSDYPTFNKAHNIINQAIKRGYLSDPGIDTDKKGHGTAVNHDIYDFTPGVVLVQERTTEITKYGNSPKKDYYLIVRIKGKVILYAAPKKMTIARSAKKSPEPGQIIKKIAGGGKNSREVFAFFVAKRMRLGN